MNPMTAKNRAVQFKGITVCTGNIYDNRVKLDKLFQETIKDTPYAEITGASPPEDSPEKAVILTGNDFKDFCETQLGIYIPQAMLSAKTLGDWASLREDKRFSEETLPRIEKMYSSPDGEAELYAKVLAYAAQKEAQGGKDIDGNPIINISV
jgi:hypothetical protein